jgi:hypothetical protein
MPCTFEDIARVLIAAPCAWLEPRSIAAELGEDLDWVASVLAELHGRGLVAVWVEHDPLVVTLTPLAAKRLGVELVAARDADVYRWSADAAGAKPRRPTRAQAERTDDHAALLDQFADRKAVDPAIAAERRDEAERRIARRRPARADMRPTVLLAGPPGVWAEARHRRRFELRCRVCRDCSGRARRGLLSRCTACGLGMRPTIGDSTCPGCDGRRLRPWEYCLRCDRWGMDHLRRPAKKRRSASPPRIRSA